MKRMNNKNVVRVYNMTINNALLGDTIYSRAIQQFSGIELLYAVSTVNTVLNQRHK